MEKNVYLFGTVKANTRELPIELKSPKVCKDAVIRRSWDGCSKELSCPPHVELYNKYMNAVDHSDQTRYFGEKVLSLVDVLLLVSNRSMFFKCTHLDERISKPQKVENVKL